MLERGSQNCLRVSFMCNVCVFNVRVAVLTNRTSLFFGVVNNCSGHESHMGVLYPFHGKY